MLESIENESPVQRILYDAREATKMLGVSLRTLWNLTNDGKIRAVRIGRLVRYDIADLLAFIGQQKGA